MKVTLILDPASGEAIFAIAPPVWVCDSTVNRLAAERRWSAPGSDPVAVAVFSSMARPTVPRRGTVGDAEMARTLRRARGRSLRVRAGMNSPDRRFRAA